MDCIEIDIEDVDRYLDINDKSYLLGVLLKIQNGRNEIKTGDMSK